MGLDIFGVCEIEINFGFWIIIGIIFVFGDGKGIGIIFFGKLELKIVEVIYWVDFLGLRIKLLCKVKVIL